MYLVILWCKPEQDNTIPNLFHLSSLPVGDETTKILDPRNCYDLSFRHPFVASSKLSRLYVTNESFFLAVNSRLEIIFASFQYLKSLVWMFHLLFNLLSAITILITLFKYHHGFRISLRRSLLRKQVLVESTALRETLETGLTAVMDLVWGW